MFLKSSMFIKKMAFQDKTNSIQKTIKPFLTLLLVPVFLLSGEFSYAGKLNDFETAASTKKKMNHYQSSSNHSHYSDHHDGDFWVELIFDIVESAFFSPSKHDQRNSHVDVGYPSLDVILRRKVKAPQLPNFRIDGYFSNMSSDISSRNIGVEVGHGLFALKVDNHQFRERNPEDDLELQSIHGLLRVSYSSAFEVDFGIGQTYIKGDDEHSKLSVTLPIKAKFNESISFELKPVWTVGRDQTLRELDYGVLFHKDGVGIKVGYQNFTAGSESLRGAYLGLSLIF